MTTDITVKTRIRVNGQEYASVDDMPDDVRQLYQRALATIAGGKHSGLLDISGQGASTNAHAVSGLSDSQEHTSVDQVHLHVA